MLCWGRVGVTARSDFPGTTSTGARALAPGRAADANPPVPPSWAGPAPPCPRSAGTAPALPVRQREGRGGRSQRTSRTGTTTLNSPHPRQSLAISWPDSARPHRSLAGTFHGGASLRRPRSRPVNTTATLTPGENLQEGEPRGSCRGPVPSPIAGRWTSRPAGRGPPRTENTVRAVRREAKGEAAVRPRDLLGTADRGLFGGDAPCGQG